jgi:uncharacterized protein YndB with AHSA1/START domain
MAASTFMYVTYIRTTMEKLWTALTDAEIIQQWWFGTRCESEWRAGSPWKMIYPDGHIPDTGEILTAKRPSKLVIRWQHQLVPEFNAEGDSLCTMEMESDGSAVRLILTHAIDREHSKFIAAVSHAWPMVLSNLKSLLETGSVVLHDRPTH